MQLYHFSLPCRDKDAHELCFISHPKHDKRIRCDFFGNLSMNECWEGYEIWKFVKIKTSNDNENNNDDDGNFFISSWAHENKVLASSHDFKILTKDNKKDSTEEWKVIKHPKTKGIAIQSVAHGRYMAFRNEELCTVKDLEEQDACWYLEPGNMHQFFLSSQNFDGRLSYHFEEKSIRTTQCRRSDEKWSIEPIYGEGIPSFAIKSNRHGEFLGVGDDGNLCTVEKYTEWIIVASPQNGVFLQLLKDPNKRLACNGKGHIFLSMEQGLQETWQLERIMPDTMSTKKIWKWVNVGLFATAGALVAPVAVVGAVGAMGFTASGIASGSMAAGMMSLEAIASGGGVIVGGTVATLQSIGAAGLGVLGTTAAAGTGAAVAGVATKAIDQHVAPDNETGQKALTSLNFASTHPLCSWREW